PYFDVAFAHPPFDIGFEVVSKCLVLAKNVVVLQHLGWLDSGRRNGKNEFLKNCVPDIYVLPNPIAAEQHAFFHWPPVENRFKDCRQTIDLRETSEEERIRG